MGIYILPSNSTNSKLQTLTISTTTVSNHRNLRQTKKKERLFKINENNRVISAQTLTLEF